MKKAFIVLFVAFTALASAQTQDGWEKWQQTSCYSKILFRIKEEKKNGSRHQWKIQFRSEFSNTISFNYHVTDKLEQYNTTTRRKTLNAKQTSEEIEVYTDIDNILIIVDDVSMSPYPENYIDCDH